MKDVKKFLEKFNVKVIDDNIIKVLLDKRCEMACIEVNSEVIMEGNYWDFHNSCHGGAFDLLPYFYRYRDLVEIFNNYFIKNNLNVKIIYDEYKYE